MKTFYFYARWTIAVILAHLFILLNTSAALFFCYLHSGYIYMNFFGAAFGFIIFVISSMLAYFMLIEMSESIKKGFSG